MNGVPNTVAYEGDLTDPNRPEGWDARILITPNFFDEYSIPTVEGPSPIDTSKWISIASFNPRPGMLYPIGLIELVLEAQKAWDNNVLLHRLGNTWLTFYVPRKQPHTKNST